MRDMTNLPKDPVMLLSVINTKLRDQYDSFSSCCEDLDLDSQEMIEKLRTINYEYDENQNQFI